MLKSVLVIVLTNSRASISQDTTFENHWSRTTFDGFDEPT